LIAAQVRERRLVVWFDPEAHYAAFVRDLALPNTRIEVYAGSFFALRHAIDPLLRDDRLPRLLVYVPQAEAATAHALIELTAAGAVLAPDAHDAACKTGLGFIARAALLAQPGDWPEDLALDIAAQIEAGQISTLDEADRVVGRVGEIPGVIPVIFETANPSDVALLFLSDPAYDPKISSKKATGVVAQFLGAAFGREFAPTITCAALREQLARHVLTTEFLAGLPAPLPAALATVPTPPPGPAREACVRLARTWRDRRALRESYADAAARVEAELGLAPLPLTLDQLTAVETFAGLERRLQEQLEAHLIAEPVWSWEEQTHRQQMITARQSDFWSVWPERFEGVGARWQLIRDALDLLFAAQRIEADLRTFNGGPADLLARYTAPGDDAWCLLDTYHRHLERHHHDFNFGAAAQHDSLERLIRRAEARYMEVGGALAERWVRALAAARFQVPGARRQVEIFNHYVAPPLKDHQKTAYILVDALRYEMARELVESLERTQNYTVQCDPVLGTVPTITDIGMAALLPGVEQGAQVVPTGPGKLGLAIGGTVLKDRKSRIEWFRAHVGGQVVVATLESMLPKPKRALDDELKAAPVILVTSQEIDALAEGDNIHLARKEMDGILLEVAKLVNKLRDYGCRRIIITADHGYLFGDELDTDMKLDPPGGHTADLHRRVWVGQGGTNEPGFLRAPLKQFGLSDNLEIAVPWGFGAFTTPGGARAYFHGGMAPQELVVPVAVLTPVGVDFSGTSPDNQFAWTIRPGSKKISTRFFSVQIEGQVTGLFAAEPPRVRVEVRDKSRVLGVPISAFYGFTEATRDIEMRLKDDDRQQIEPNSVTLTFTEENLPKTVSIVLLDAATGRTLKLIDNLEVASFAI
jgi:hypothetical protein